MQRNSINTLFIKSIFFCLCLIWYEIMSITTHILPPLIGLFFAYLMILKNESERIMNNLDKRWYFSICFLIFAEQIHGFELFSSILAFLVFYYFINDWLKINMKCRQCLLVIFVFAGYFGTFFISQLILYILNQPSLEISYEYFFYIFLESLICIFFFKDRVL